MRTANLAAALITGLLTATSATAQTWPSSGYFDIVQLEDSCAVISEFQFEGRSDVSFFLGYDGDEVSIAFLSYGWSRSDGQTYEMTYLFRPQTAYTGDAIGMSNAGEHGFVAIFGSEVLDHFAQAESLQVIRPGSDSSVTHINLRGSAAATATLRRCVDHVLRANAEQARQESRWDYIERDPFAPSTGQSVDGITNPSWSRRPTPEFPERAIEQGVLSGNVSLRCTAESSGAVSGCSIVSETPAGFGFGEAALRAAGRARLSPRTVDGAATAATVTFTVYFEHGV